MTNKIPRIGAPLLSPDSLLWPDLIANHHTQKDKQDLPTEILTYFDHDRSLKLCQTSTYFGP